jgi:hypothetical protein
VAEEALMPKPDPLGRVVRRRLEFLPDGLRTEATDRFMSGETIAVMFDDYRDFLPIPPDRRPKIADRRRKIYLAYCVRQDAAERGLVPAIGLERRRSCTRTLAMIHTRTSRGFCAEPTRARARSGTRSGTGRRTETRRTGRDDHVAGCWSPRRRSRVRQATARLPRPRAGGGPRCGRRAGPVPSCASRTGRTRSCPRGPRSRA